MLHGCPWVLPRPVFVLACKGPGAAAEDDIRNTYTLRTKVEQEGAADALAKVGTGKCRHRMQRTGHLQRLHVISSC